MSLLKHRKSLRGIFLSGIISIICSGVLGVGPVSNGAVAYAMAASDQHLASTNCPAVADPTGQSLLVVLLDRSGSLIVPPATDPNKYSTSVTKALADLWPGSMAVVAFSNNTAQVLGPARLSDLTQRTNLKNSVENYPIGGNTPLGPAMHKALTLLQGAPAGSRVILITDGNPTGEGDNDGAHQEQDIRNNLIPQFCSLGIPVSAFGLTINPNTSDGQDANRLLTDITVGTGATYTNVRSPEELAQAVIRLAAQWQHLNFTKANGDSSGQNFPVSIDTFAQQVDVVTFRSDSQYNITLLGPDKQPFTQGVQQFTDRHYEIDVLDTSGPFVAGTYTVNVGGDANAQVYELVKSPLQVKLTEPTTKTVAYVGQPVHIEAELLNGSDVITPQAGQAQLIAHVTLLVNGQAVGPGNDVVLTQHGAIFSGDTLAYKQLGTVQIQVLATYQQVKRNSSASVQLVPAPVPPCREGFLQCTWMQYQTQILIIGPLVLLFLILLLRLLRPAPYGALASRGQIEPLGQSFFGRIFGPSSINSKKLEGVFDLHGGRFKITFRGGAHIKASSDVPTITVKSGNSLTKVDKAGVPLNDKDVINIAGYDVATFLDVDPTTEEI